MQRVVVDAGPLVAYLNPKDQWHSWAKDAFSRLQGPLLSCEPVIAEAAHLASRLQQGRNRVLAMIQEIPIKIPFQLIEDVERLNVLLARYNDIDMDLADACLVRMAELDERTVVMTVDHDFLVYRKNGRSLIPIIAPFA